LTYCTTMTTCPAGLSVTVTRWSDRPTEDGDGKRLAAGLLRETGRRELGPVLRAGERLPCEQRFETVAAVLLALPRSCPGSGEPGHSLIPHASASSSRVKVRPSPESDRMRLSASASPASRRRRRFSARRASSSARGIETMSSACVATRTPHQQRALFIPSLLTMRGLIR